MQSIISGFKKVFDKREGVYIFLISFFLIIFLFFIFQNIKQSISVFDFSFLSFGKKISLFLQTLFDTTQLTGVGVLFLVLGVSTSGALTFSLIYIYVKTRKDLLLKSGLYSGFGLILAIFGMGCAACGAVFLQVVLSFFGFGGLLTLFPYNGVEIGYIGLVLLFVNSILLAYRLVNHLFAKLF